MKLESMATLVSSATNLLVPLQEPWILPPRTRYSKLKNVLARRGGFLGLTCRCRKRKFIQIRAAVSSALTDIEEPLLSIQSLKTYEKQDICGKIVMVRIDGRLFLPKGEYQHKNAIDTLVYICNARPKALVITYNIFITKDNSASETAQHLAEYISVLLGKRVSVSDEIFEDNVEQRISGLENGGILLLPNLSLYRDETANALSFARNVSVKVDIFVNDSFSDSHRVLASTVGVTRFTSARIAGFYLTEMVSMFAKVLEKTMHPLLSIIGGAKIVEKRDALISLLQKSNVMFFPGEISFSLLHALGASIPQNLLNVHTIEVAKKFLVAAKQRNVRVILPRDFWCVNESNPLQGLQIFSSYCVLNGWRPVDIGPATVSEIASVLGNSKKVLWIGPITSPFAREKSHGSLQVACILGKCCENGLCSAFVLGRDICNIVRQVPNSALIHLIYEHGTASWELLKGKKLAAVASLDNEYPRNLDWNSIFDDPLRPLVVDIGSGNGLFLLRMSEVFQDWNFLGIEINRKLVDRSFSQLKQLGLMNGHFIHADATTSFKPVVSSYPGKLIMVSLQCPNPNFRDTEHRRRMLQESLIKAIVDQICVSGKIFLQSDVKSVAIRIKNELLAYGEEQLVADFEVRDEHEYDTEGWLNNNPFGIYSDWEKHALDRGRRMYRYLLVKHAHGKQCT